MGGRERTVATLSALIFSVVGNLCQLYAGKPVAFDLSGQHALAPQELGLQVAGHLESFVHNLTCPVDKRAAPPSCESCGSSFHWISALLAAVSSCGSFVVGLCFRRSPPPTSIQRISVEPEPQPRSSGKVKQGGPASHLAVDASRW